MILTNSGKRIKIDTRRLGQFSKGIGLMFRRSRSDNLLFEFKKDVKMAIHSFFVFFPFLAIWVDSKNRVIDFEIVRPFRPRVMPKKKFRKLIEVPINFKNREIIKFFIKGN